MSTSFSRSMRSLHNDGFRRWLIGILLVLVLLSGWLYWLLFSEVTLYETAATARLEVVPGIHPIEASVEGRIVTTNLELGKEVEIGDILIEIDSSAQKLQRKEEQGRLEALLPALEALQGELAALDRGLFAGKKGGKAALKEARARYREADASAKLAESELKRLQKLFDQNAISDIEYQRAKTEAERSRAVADTLLSAIQTQRWTQEASGSDQEATAKRLKGEMARLEGEIASKRTLIERLTNEIEKCAIRTPISGKLAQVSGVSIGEVVRPGDKMASVIPEGKLQAVAEFDPQSSVGKIYPGQNAQIKLDGFPWTEYGVVPANVSRVANETQEGKVKVIFEIHPLTGSLIPLQHGLLGSVEVEVESVSPATLVLRTTGQRLADANATSGSKP